MRSIVIIAFMACALSLGACHNSAPKTTKKYKYYCTMNPDQGSDKPGVCGKCGMELVERDTTAK
jgi:hypothetical protein